MYYLVPRKLVANLYLENDRLLFHRCSILSSFLAPEVCDLSLLCCMSPVTDTIF